MVVASIYDCRPSLSRVLRPLRLKATDRQTDSHVSPAASSLLITLIFCQNQMLLPTLQLLQLLWSCPCIQHLPAEAQESLSLLFLLFLGRNKDTKRSLALEPCSRLGDRPGPSTVGSATSISPPDAHRALGCKPEPSILTDFPQSLLSLPPPHLLLLKDKDSRKKPLQRCHPRPF